MNRCVNDEGFTLIEVMVAIAVVTVGIVGVLTMQTTSISGNAGANRISSASVWASKEIERFIYMKYDDVIFNDIGVAGSGGLNSTTIGADGTKTVESQDGRYNIYWNVADDYPVLNVKTIRVIVTRQDVGLERTVTINYVKSKYD